ncbi:hypothetical protein [Halorussus sp. AFM4]|uniref:hypothetical protein n=1 Tax=Halorussus sp. AFM4 TaxID=3421651 RepID=UPI003EBE4645
MAEAPEVASPQVRPQPRREHGRGRRDGDGGRPLGGPLGVRASRGETFAERFGEGEVTEPEEVAEATAVADRREKPTSGGLDVYQRHEFPRF